MKTLAQFKKDDIFTYSFGITVAIAAYLITNHVIATWVEQAN